MAAMLSQTHLKIFLIQKCQIHSCILYLKKYKIDVKNLTVNSRRYQTVDSNHLFINLCSILNYVVVNSDMQESIYDAFRLECINLP